MRSANSEDLGQILTLIEEKPSKDCFTKAFKSKEVYISVLEGEEVEENKIIGVMIGFHKNFLKKTCFKDNEIIQRLLKEIRYEFTYITNLFITKDHQGKNYERMLIMSFLDDTKKQTLLKPIQFEPEKDQKSIDLFRSFKFRLEMEISTKEKETIGIYEYDN